MIYVDDFRMKGIVRNYKARWSHLLCFPPDDQALIEFAESIGLKRHWIQYGMWTYFDVTDNKRKLVIRNGATAITTSQYCALSRKYAHLKSKRQQ